ncbi:hypothetical protein HCU64_15000 [Methylobacterium sp. C25]|uniref:DUF6894 family protein n=1 Tax=Methylobacterium sp. C25 TaxID=2721622 RepID=UPI001F190F63|nr:hypothetical protein [Methylobacterium sp. C25]MCE4225066.1 hypothetical protein [Methylobacterium sp. C25]
MPRFFFHLEHGLESIRDDEGVLADDAETAVTQASKAFAEMREAGELPSANEEWMLVVRDEQHNELSRIVIQ